MSRPTRRHFLASSALAAAAPLPAAPQADQKRNLLTSSWTPEAIAAALMSRDRFHPLPTAADRPAWQEVPADAASALIAAGERQLKTPWEILPATLALEFKRNGNRSRYEAVRDRRRKKLQDLVIAECFEAKGR